MPSTHISGEEEFRTRIDKAGSKLVVVDFSASWCGPCKEIAPFFETLSERYQTEADFLKVDINECPEIASKNDVMSLPTFLFFKNGKVIFRLKGANSSRLEDKVVDLIGNTQTTTEAKTDGVNTLGNTYRDPGLAGLVSGFLQAVLPSKPGNGNHVPTFKGEGQRLGDGTDVKKPEEEVKTDDGKASSGWFSGWFKGKTTPPATSQVDSKSQMEVDDSQPVTQIHVRLADGTRLLVKLNTGQPVSKIRDFIIENRPQYSTSTFALMTGFPPTDIANESMPIEEANLGNSLVYQKLQ